MRRIIIIFIVCLSKLHAQDPHFSQFNTAKLNLNPALVSFNSSDIKLFYIENLNGVRLLIHLKH